METNNTKQTWAVVKLADADPLSSFVMASWLSSYRRSKWAGVIPNNRYAEITSEAISQLRRRGAAVFVACDPDNPDLQIGYVVLERTSDDIPVIHYAYVKDYARKQGVAKSLFAAANVDYRTKFFYTFRTNEARYFTGGVYEPSIARRKLA